MEKRFASIWFPYLKADWFANRHSRLCTIPFVLALRMHGRMIITAVNRLTAVQQVREGMAVADAKAFLPSLEVFDEPERLSEKLLRSIGRWCIRYTPVVAIDPPDGLMLDISGCPHLWGGEKPYVSDITDRLRDRGYDARIAVADTQAAAWAVARYGTGDLIVARYEQLEALLPLPPAALRLEPHVVERLHKLGLKTVGSFASMGRNVLRRRFGEGLLLRMGQALGGEPEPIQPLKPVQGYEERMPCLEPISTRKGIEIALQKLLDALCKRLSEEGKGLREALLICYRIDGRTVQIGIGTSRASASAAHVFKLFELKISHIEPDLGIELFLLRAGKVEDMDRTQEALWNGGGALKTAEISELLDRLKARDGRCVIRRYLPSEHYWPENSVRLAESLTEMPDTAWRMDRPRPVRLLEVPEPIQVAAPIPDYPPILFRYKGRVHTIRKADGPERIERAWWMEKGEHRDYYYVEDEEGRRYWLYRSGHYGDGHAKRWFLHGFFA
jgi:protein ImuB